jgi:hypothetical protein
LDLAAALSSSHQFRVRTSKAAIRLLVANGAIWPDHAVQVMKFTRGRPTATCDPLKPLELSRSNVCFWKIEQLAFCRSASQE